MRSPKSKIIRLSIRAFILVFLTTVGACSHGRVLVEGDAGSVVVEHDSRYYQSRLPDIPPGHMPPPGKCRIWYPDLTPGQQPPPGDCWELSRRVPPGAWLIRGE
jgi:hypothetical protein